MKNFRRKLKSKRGETLIEILVSIMIVALSAGMFAAMYNASMQIDRTARQQDELFYEAVGALEEMKDSEKTEKTQGQVQYHPATGDEQNVDVEVLTQDGLSVYLG